MSRTTPRRTQEERRSATRARLLEAAAACLLEHGYAATSVGQVQERAGLARGTLLHHFPTKADLMVAATAHVVDERIERFRRQAGRIPTGKDRLSAVVDLAWRDLSSPVFFTALELWMAARTDDELRSRMVEEEARLFQAMQASYVEVLGDDYADDPRAATLLEFTLDVLTGLSITTLVTGGLGRRAPLVDRWKRALSVLFGELDAARLVDGSSLP
jgi:AcrR family transcriptional regulator